MHLSIVRHHQTAIPSGVAKISSFYEENLSDPNPQTANIKSGIRAENLGLLKVMVRKKIPCVNCNLDLWDMTLNQGHDMIV